VRELQVRRIAGEPLQNRRTTNFLGRQFEAVIPVRRVDPTAQRV
jgi:hypothetical protein